VSQHLKVLRESGFANVRAEAQRRLYSVDVAGLRAVDAARGAFAAEPGVEHLGRAALRCRAVAQSSWPVRPVDHGMEM
ncbi:hypothetical protein MOV75_40585, partial [Bradyrhizobium sp. PRIMUS42]|nr:hypothetical protein [Bradyrhizobium sp. PRIMUS42]